MSLLITICARGGSKGIPGKNIKPLNGKPLIAYTIDTAFRFAEAYGDAQVVLSTDSPQIMQVAAEFGLCSDYRRPDELATDTIGKLDVVRDVWTFYEKKEGHRYNYLLDLDITSPLRTLKDLQDAFQMLQNDPQAVNLFSVSPAARNPYFNMVEKKENGYYGKVKPLSTAVFSRQAAPQVYDLNASFYFYRRSFFEQGYREAITDKSLIYNVPHLCFDLDHPIDFEFLSFLLSHDKLDFTL